MTTCEICFAVHDASLFSHQTWNTKLYENETFVVLPSVGPLIEGQTIIAGKKHSLNLFSMTNEEKRDFYPIVKHAENILGGHILFAEHGTFLKQKGGSCIDHTHIHVIPCYGKYYNILDSILSISEITVDIKILENSSQLDFPYILTFNLMGDYRLYEAYNAHSQMIRKAICLEEKIGFINWKDNLRIDLIHKTVELWNQK